MENTQARAVDVKKGYSMEDCLQDVMADVEDLEAMAEAGDSSNFEADEAAKKSLFISTLADKFGNLYKQTGRMDFRKLLAFGEFCRAHLRSAGAKDMNELYEYLKGGDGFKGFNLLNILFNEVKEQFDATLDVRKYQGRDLAAEAEVAKANVNAGRGETNAQVAAASSGLELDAATRARLGYASSTSTLAGQVNKYGAPSKYAGGGSARNIQNRDAA